MTGRSRPSSGDRTPCIHIIEPDPGGHRMLLVRWCLLDAPTGWRWVVHTTAAGLEHPALLDVLRRRQPHVHYRRMPAMAPLGYDALGQFRYQWRSVRVILRQMVACFRRDDRIFIPYIDACQGLALWPGWLYRMPLFALGMRDNAHREDLGLARPGPWGRFRRWAWERFLGSGRLRAYFSNQWPYCEWAREHQASVPIYLPDPANEPRPLPRQQACRQLGLDPERAWILCYGSLTPRKGVVDLLDLLARAEWPAKVGVVLAGRCDAAVRAVVEVRLQDLGGRLRVFDRFIDDEDENALFQAADLVWLVYRDHLGMSGVLVQAGMHGRPVVTGPNGVLAWYRARFGLGPCLTAAMSPAHQVATLAGWLADADRCRRAGERGRRLFAVHTVAEFRRRLFAVLLR